MTPNAACSEYILQTLDSEIDTVPFIFLSAISDESSAVGVVPATSDPKYLSTIFWRRRQTDRVMRKMTMHPTAIPIM